MAQRRMFSPAIVSSDAFLDMPSSSQALYFHLCMNADDDGFVNPKKIMRMIGVSDDDLKVLLAKRFLLSFEDGVVVVKHWLIHNMIRKDRYKETQYIEDKKTLIIKDNMAYTESLLPTRQPNVNQMAPQFRLGKVRLVDTATKVADSPFSFKEEIKKLEDNKRRDLNIIALYFEKKKPDIKNREQYKVALKRHFRAAKDLVPFEDGQILKACGIAEKEYPKIWTIETLVKILTK